MKLNKLLYSTIALSFLGLAGTSTPFNSNDLVVQAKIKHHKKVKGESYSQFKKSKYGYGKFGVIYKDTKFNEKVGNLNQKQFKNKSFKVVGVVKVKLTNGHTELFYKVIRNDVSGYVKVKHLHIYNDHSGKNDTHKKTHNNGKKDTTTTSSSSSNSSQTSTNSSLTSSSASSSSSTSTSDNQNYWNGAFGGQTNENSGVITNSSSNNNIFNPTIDNNSNSNSNSTGTNGSASNSGNSSNTDSNSASSNNSSNANSNSASNNDNGSSANSNSASNNDNSSSANSNSASNNDNGSSANSNSASNNDNGFSANSNSASNNDNGSSANSNSASNNDNGSSANSNSASNNDNSSSANSNSASNNDNGSSANSNSASNNDNGSSANSNSASNNDNGSSANSNSASSNNSSSSSNSSNASQDAQDAAKIQEYQEEAQKIGNGSSDSDTYAVAPTYENGTFNPGQLNPTFIQNSVKWINFFRNMLGLSPLTNNDQWNQDAQYGAATTAAGNAAAGTTDQISHGLKVFSQPSYISDADWQRGVDATKNSNLGYGTKSPYDVIAGFLNDSDNLLSAGGPGHRLQLTGNIGKVGIGQTGEFSDVKVTDDNFRPKDSDKVTTPVNFPGSGVFPYELVEKAPWSVAFPTNYNGGNGTTPTVSLHDNTTNQDVNVSDVNINGTTETKTESNGTIIYNGYGYFGSYVWFTPDSNAIQPDHSYTVTINGIPGTSSPYTYTTKLFNLGVQSNN